MASYSKRRRFGGVSRGRGRRVYGRSRIVKKVGGRRRLTTDVSTPRYGSATGAYPFADMPLPKRQRVSGMMGVRRGQPFKRVAVRRKFAGSNTTLVKSVRELKRVRFSYGKGTGYKTGKLLRMSVPMRILRYQGMKADDTVDGTNDTNVGLYAGNYPMFNGISAATNTATCPLYVFALNDTSQTGNRATPFYQMNIASTGAITWTAQNGVSQAGGSDSGWGVEKDETGSFQNATCRWIVNNWYDVRLKMYGCKNQQVSFFVDYVQCLADYATIEDEGLLAGATAISDRWRDDVYSYWQNMLKPLVSNTLSTFNNVKRPSTGVFRVIKSWKFDIAPEQSDAVDTTPNAVQARLYVKDGRMCDYQWLPNPNAYDAANVSANDGVDDRLVNPNRYNPANNNQYTGIDLRPAPRGRRYLVIRASNSTEGGNTARDVPSFDILLRKSEQLGSSSTLP